MKVRDLKKIIDELPEEDLELNVAVYADHGQTVETTDEAGFEWCDCEDSDMIHPDDLSEYDLTSDYVERLFVIGG